VSGSYLECSNLHSQADTNSREVHPATFLEGIFLTDKFCIAKAFVNYCFCFPQEHKHEVQMTGKHSSTETSASWNFERL